MTATQQYNLEQLPLWVQNRDVVLAYYQQAKIDWRYGKIPDYTRSNQKLATESTRNHPQGSLEALVQNLVRTFDIEANFKINPEQWMSVDVEKFRMSTNGGAAYTVSDIVGNGTYKLLIGDTPRYQASSESFDSSTNLFHTAFPDGFLWEVLEVYSQPPVISFKWRHWGRFYGRYKNFPPTGELVEIIGMSVVRLSENFKIISLDHYYDNNHFLNTLTSGGQKMSSANYPQFAVSQQNGRYSSVSLSLLPIIKQMYQRKKNTIEASLKAQSAVSKCPFNALTKKVEFS